jgi:hypothetical protein
MHLVAPLDRHFPLLYAILKEHIADDVDYKVCFLICNQLYFRVSLFFYYETHNMVTKNIIFWISILLLQNINCDLTIQFYFHHHVYIVLEDM